MTPIGKPDPRLPLLGLMALVENDLQLTIDGGNTRFRIYKSLRLFLTDWYRGFFD